MDGTLALKKYDVLGRIKALEEGGGGGGLQIKSFEYTGTGTANHTITFPETPAFVLGVYQKEPNQAGTVYNIFPFAWGNRALLCAYRSQGVGTVALKGELSGLELSITGASDGVGSCNVENEVYKVMYLA